MSVINCRYETGPEKKTGKRRGESEISEGIAQECHQARWQSVAGEEGKRLEIQEVSKALGLKKRNAPRKGC